MKFNMEDSPQFEYSFMREKRERQEAEAAQNGGHDINARNQHTNAADQDDHDRIQPTPAHIKHTRQVLRNVNVYVSKKLCKAQGELSKLVELLGGEYSWTYSAATCTHFIYQGKLCDVNKELAAAKEAGKVIVTPEWLHACYEQRAHVSESLFVPPLGKSESDLVNHVSNEDDIPNQKENNNETTDLGVTENSTSTEQAQKDEEHTMKRAMLDQLQDQLVKIGKSNKNNSLNQKKLNRNKSDVDNSGLTVTPTTSALNLPDSEETAMLQQLEFNGDEVTRKRKVNANGKIPASISSENMDGGGPKNGKFMNDNFDDVASCNIMPSQIQVTMWKDNPDSLGSTVAGGGATAAGAGSRGSARSGSTSGRNQRAPASSKTDAIAERIVHATRMASSNSKK
jgi:hypothetical protein